MEQQHMFTNRMIRNLLVPVVLEQILNSIMGTADTMMVSNVGSAALSAVSLVDSINILLIQAFSAAMCIHMINWITIVKPLVWTMGFVPGYGLRAAGDVKFSMITSCCTMWACRFCLCVFLIRVLGFGPMGVWIGMFADWTVRGIIFTWRFHSRKWLEHKVI